ncbi:DNA N-6-adenine-methyltransferase, partial [Enterococcus faecium]|uniref:DNA N-6-adenine-methyltransferase n=1 Tax=Enterococcus faecium TaxID=1352 RepID=UPI000CF35494
MINNSMFTSNKEDWETPQELFEELNKEFNFEIDVAASDENAKLPKYYTKKKNALNEVWEGNVFCNPPYGKQLAKWVKKAHDEYERDQNRVIVLGTSACA